MHKIVDLDLRPRHDPLSGHLFCFRGRRGDLLKVIWLDGQGACLFTQRLERGRFLWPRPADGVVTISSAQLGYPLSGIDWRHPQETWATGLGGITFCLRLLTNMILSWRDTAI